ELVPAGKLPPRFENEIATRDGRRVLVSWHNGYLRDGRGAVVGTTSIGENVTERRAADRALADSERRYRSLVEDMPALVCRFRPDGVLTFVNDQYRAYFGFKDRSEVEGRDFFQFIPEAQREQVRRHYASLTPARPAVTYEHEVIGPGGELRWQRWTDRALFDDRGSAVEYQSMGEDITERRRTEERLRASLAEKEILLKEIHHRVKNNLQIVSSLLDLQARHVPERRARQMLEESTARVRSMALIHEHLFQAKEVARIDFSRYVRDLVDRLMQTHSGGEGSVAVQVDVPTLPLPLDTAIPCGLIVNELVTNALKHAFPSGRGGSVRVGIVAAGSRATLRVADDGVGMAAPVDPAAATTLGLSIVATLARQVGGRLELRGGPGTEVLLEFPVQPGEGG
ncbi:MAG TPA: histidine kinase dimerization/phosphoacceptor domain -containing protein, partial [Anaeromyxobacteraceae bacterium]|nr:histidine kinase dimerization/phosphoacceptor domain -containing protein [Anaeromyxobacteraceae bacterium]